MDFSRVELTERQAAFARDVDAFFAEWAGPALDHEERTGDGFYEPLHRAMGERGWILDTWPVSDGGAGLDAVEHRILTLAKERTGLPFTTLDTTVRVAEALRRHGDPRGLLRGVARGTIRFCLGYTEPEGGSDVAAARTRATRDGDDWVVNGSKIFTTGAHNCQYAFTLTRTNPNVPKHRGLTMFLVPLDAPGVEIRPIHTFGGERTNVVYFDGVRVADDLRVGEVDRGWSVLHERLDVEHGLVAASDGLAHPSVRTPYAVMLARCVDAVHAWLRRHPEASDDLRYRLGVVAAEAEAALSAPKHYGRVKASQALIAGTAALLEMVGSDPTGDAPVALVEYAHRFAQGTAIYGGTVEIFRNIIADELGLPRPTYPA